jgi:hypothetical protein
MLVLISQLEFVLKFASVFEGCLTTPMNILHTKEEGASGRLLKSGRDLTTVK